MPRQLRGSELRKQVDKIGVRKACQLLEDAYDQRQLEPGSFSIRDLAEELIPDGREFVRTIDHRHKSGGAVLQEAVQGVDTTTFSSITGQIVYSEVRRAFESAIMLAPYLVKPMPTVFLDGEKIPGIGAMGDHTETISEGAEYPTLGLNEEYVVSPPTEKRGWIIPVTREIIVADRTGLLMEYVGQGSKFMAINKEKRCLDIALGITNNYKRNGTATNTYLNSGAYINDQTGNALADWTSLEKAELLFDAITDPNTGEPVLITGDTLIVPTALKRTAHRILHATQIRFNDGASNTTAAYGPNPLAQRDNDGGQYRMNAAGTLTILSSPYVKSRSGSATKWYFGSPLNAFRYSEVWKIETSTAPAGHPAEFGRDIMQQHKVSERGCPWVYEPRHMTRNNT